MFVCFPNFPFPLSIRFSSAPQSPKAASLRCEFCHSSHGETVCQTVCYTDLRSDVLSLRALTLWNTITLSFHIKYQYQIARSMSKSWNKLLRHWRSAYVLFTFAHVYYFQTFIISFYRSKLYLFGIRQKQWPNKWNGKRGPRLTDSYREFHACTICSQLIATAGVYLISSI